MIIQLGITISRREFHAGNNIEKLRTFLGLSREALSLHLSVSIEAVQKLENKKRISKQSLQRLANVFNGLGLTYNITPADIIAFDVEKLEDSHGRSLFSTKFNTMHIRTKKK